jgi:conjugal transfer pilin signal peptidase TrbI
VKFNHNMILTKIVVGSPGDVVSVSGRVVRVNGVPVGFAKERSLKGEPLDPIEPSVVPPGHLYVMGLHKDSLDSRYTLVGLVPTQNVVGRAFPIL